MDGTTSAVKLSFSRPTSNDYYDHHSLQPYTIVRWLTLLSIRLLLIAFMSITNLTFSHHLLMPIILHKQQQQSYGYGSSIYDIQSTQPFVQESNLILLQSQPRLPPVYELSPPTQALHSVQLQTTVALAARGLKREAQDITTTTTPDKNHVYEWMKGTYRTKLL